MQRLWALLSLIAIAAGVALGFALAPKYQPPNASGQGRLRQRAEEFYRGLRQLDYSAAARMMTPARQYADTTDLRGKIDMTADSRHKLTSGARDVLAKAAQTIVAERLELQVEGNWAVTSGTCATYNEGVEIPMLLEQLVWVWTDGDWWNYSMSTAELAAYGNPPDFARQILLKQQGQATVREMVKMDQGTIAEKTKAQHAQQEQAPAAPEATAPDSGSK